MGTLQKILDLAVDECDKAVCVPHSEFEDFVRAVSGRWNCITLSGNGSKTPSNPSELRLHVLFLRTHSPHHTQHFKAVSEITERILLITLNISKRFQK